MAENIARARCGELLAGQKPEVAYPDEYLEGLIDRMMQANVAHLPVIARADGKLVGYVELAGPADGAPAAEAGGDAARGVLPRAVSHPEPCCRLGRAEVGYGAARPNSGIDQVAGTSS